MPDGDSVENLKILRLRLGEPPAGSIYNGLWRPLATHWAPAQLITGK